MWWHENFGRSGVDAVRVYGHAQTVVVAVFFCQCSGGVQGCLRAGKGRGRKGKNSLAAKAAQTGGIGGFKHGGFKKIHVNAGGGTGAQHFRIAHQAAQPHQFGRQLLLHGKNTLVQPVHEGHVVGQKQNSLADQKNSIKNRSLNYMRSEEKWDFRDVILQTFARTKEKKTAITVVADAALLHRLMITRN